MISVAASGLVVFFFCCCIENKRQFKRQFNTQRCGSSAIPIQRLTVFLFDRVKLTRRMHKQVQSHYKIFAIKYMVTHSWVRDKDDFICFSCKQMQTRVFNLIKRCIVAFFFFIRFCVYSMSLALDARGEMNNITRMHVNR